MSKRPAIRRLLPAGIVTAVLGLALLLPTGAGASVLGLGYGYTFGGILKGGPSATGTASTEEVFVRGSDNALWSSTVSGNTFGGWNTRGGLTVAPPGSAASSATVTDAFVEGVDGALWTSKETSGVFGAWKSLGGVITAGPGAASGFAAGQTDLFVRGGDKGVWWSLTTDGTTWGPGAGTQAGKFSAVLGVTVDSVSVTAQAGELDIYVWGQDNAIWRNSYTTAGGWSGWVTLAGRTIYAPASNSCSAGHHDVWVVGTDGALWHRSSIDNGVTWSTWASYGGLWTSNLTAFCKPGTTNVEVFGRGSDAALWRYAVTGV